MLAWGWAESGPIQRPFYEETQTGSLWVQVPDEPQINGFVIDVEGKGDHSRIVVYAWNQFYADRIRAMIAKAFHSEIRTLGE